tara:strand:- start:5899 stop:6147 length:249 start_codon:yes stop_codon:yes gene_type:complete
MSKEKFSVSLSKDEVSMVVHALVAIVEATEEVLVNDPLNESVAEEMETARHLMSRISIQLIKKHNESKNIFTDEVEANPERN